MKTTESASPFAALSPQEQKERWICWQCQHSAETVPIDVQPESGNTPALTLPPLKLPEVPPEEPNNDRLVPAIRHGQYDAVIRRMQMAQRRTTTYTSWT